MVLSKELGEVSAVLGVATLFTLEAMIHLSFLVLCRLWVAKIVNLPIDLQSLWAFG